MALSAQQAETFNNQNAGFFADRTEYKRGVFLIIYWIDHDLDDENSHAFGHTLATEFEALKKFFKESLGYEIFDCALPSTFPEDKWAATIGSILQSLHLEDSHILVLCYAGHNEMREGEAELAASVSITNMYIHVSD